MKLLGSVQKPNMTMSVKSIPIENIMMVSLFFFSLDAFWRILFFAKKMWRWYYHGTALWANHFSNQLCASAILSLSRSIKMPFLDSLIVQWTGQCFLIRKNIRPWNMRLNLWKSAQHFVRNHSSIHFVHWCFEKKPH